ncbi:quercetin 2,3-dioxygenase [Nostoc sp. UHCC 0926]|uniref:quercetin 2,3-dioxygenase n=1 Tax=unclassified Nostoc TaxID=2593658 RepID=UPI00235F4ADD|nr:quercetin 2,3-dioxygenase [Nostoc sp. UHCC 0926]WDD32506.1 quercetin 2,3-dioxygenase [Nostoc sp. UHCC 0926]
MTVNLQGILQQPGQGSSYWVFGDLCTFKAVGEETGQAYALIEITVQPQNGPPPHIHNHEDEAFYIQEGELEFQLDEQIILAIPGTFLHSPKGQLHRFTNIGSQPAKLLCWVTPAGLEKFFMEVGVPVSERTQLPSLSPADIEKILAAAPRYGLEIILPSAESSQV